MSDVSKHPSSGSFWLSVVGVIGCFLIFAVILYVAYLPARVATTPAIPAGLSEEERLERRLYTPEERRQIYTEMRIREDHALASYQWIDREKGIVRLPIDRAVELIVRDAQAGKP